MKWCEEEEVKYVLGLSKNERLTKMISEEMDEAKRCTRPVVRRSG